MLRPSRTDFPSLCTHLLRCQSNLSLCKNNNRDAPSSINSPTKIFEIPDIEMATRSLTLCPISRETSCHSSERSCVWALLGAEEQTISSTPSAAHHQQHTISSKQNGTAARKSLLNMLCTLPLTPSSTLFGSVLNYCARCPTQRMMPPYLAHDALFESRAAVSLVSSLLWLAH